MPLEAETRWIKDPDVNKKIYHIFENFKIFFLPNKTTKQMKRTYKPNDNFYFIS